MMPTHQDPEIYTDEGDPEIDPAPPAPPSAATLSNLLSLLLAGSETSEQIGNKVLLLAQAVNHPNAPKTCREMAERMRVSPSEANRRGTRFRSELARIRAFHANDGTNAPR